MVDRHNDGCGSREFLRNICVHANLRGTGVEIADPSEGLTAAKSYDTREGGKSKELHCFQLLCSLEVEEVVYQVAGSFGFLLSAGGQSPG